MLRIVPLAGKRVRRRFSTDLAAFANAVIYSLHWGESMTMEPAYYVGVFTATSWRLFLEAGGTTAGFPSSAWTRVIKLKIGDYLLCYIVDAKQWIGLIRVTGEPYFDSKLPIWGPDLFPARAPVELVVELREDTAVSATDLIRHLPRLRAAADRHPGAWAGFLRGSPRRWPPQEAKVVIDALRRAQRN